MVGLYGGGPVGNATLEAMGTDAIPSSTGEVHGAVLGGTLSENVTPKLYRAYQRGQVSGSETTDEFGNAWPSAPPVDLLTKDDANRDYGIAGHLTFDSDTPRGVAEQLHGLKRDELLRQDVIARRDGGLATGALARFATGLFGSLLDPLNVASAFIPVVGEARYAAWLANAGSAVGRAGIRAGVGAAEGAVGSLVLEPLNYGLAQREQADYTATDSLLNIAMGTVLGGGLHVVGGAVADRVTGRYANPITERIENAGPEAREMLLRGALAAVAEGRPVEVARVLDVVEAERRATGDAASMSVAPEAQTPPPVTAGAPFVLQSTDVAPADAGRLTSLLTEGPKTSGNTRGQDVPTPMNLSAGAGVDNPAVRRAAIDTVTSAEARRFDHPDDVAAAGRLADLQERAPDPVGDQAPPRALADPHPDLASVTADITAHMVEVEGHVTAGRLTETDVRALREADELVAQSEAEARAYEAAAACFLAKGV